MAQFVHFPDKIKTGSTFEGLVSTIDIGPTILEYAGIDKKSTYDMDGTSWASAVSDSGSTDSEWSDRCLFFELGNDRCVKCGCDVYMRLNQNRSTTRNTAESEGLFLDGGQDQLFHVCNETGGRIYSPAANPQVNGSTLLMSEADMVTTLSTLLDCHLEKTLPGSVPDYATNCRSTETPTKSPTAVPTSEPTSAPTSAPMKQPTNSSTRNSAKGTTAVKAVCEDANTFEVPIGKKGRDQDADLRVGLQGQQERA